MTLQEIVGSKNRVKVLRALFQRDGLSGRQVAGQAGIAPSASKTSLEELVEAGLVLQNPHRGSLIHDLNRSHYLATPLHRLFTEEARLPQSVTDDVHRTLRTLDTATDLLCVGIASTGGVTLATAPPVDPTAPPIAVLAQQLRSRYGLRLSACVTDPAAVPAAQRVWSLPRDASIRNRVSKRDRQRALCFFGISANGDGDAAPGRDTEPD